jgi:phytoene dehydrogenase-like protein
MDLLAQACGLQLQDFAGQDSDVLMQVHLPDGRRVFRTAQEAQDPASIEILGKGAPAFWQWQTRIAQAVWSLALRKFPFPPQTAVEASKLWQSATDWLFEQPKHLTQLPELALAAFHPLWQFVPPENPVLHWFLDGQLLISAQTTLRSANALYAAAALDLPRRGVRHLSGGMGAIAEKLVAVILQNGGQVLYRHTVERIVLENGRVIAVEVGGRNAGSFSTRRVVANLTPWNVRALLGDACPRILRQLPELPNGWGAFVLHLAVARSVFPANTPLHSQLLAPAIQHGAPFGEGNSAFLSISPTWDLSRVAPCECAVTISTHTALAQWQAYRADRQTYSQAKERLSEKLLDLAERTFPHLREAIRFSMSGSPITYAFYTRRSAGWVGGFPQVNLWQSQSPAILPGLWLVGDSIFPGQSTAAVALGGLRVAESVAQW